MPQWGVEVRGFPKGEVSREVGCRGIDEDHIRVNWDVSDDGHWTFGNNRRGLGD